MTPVPSVPSVRSAHIFKLINSKPAKPSRGALSAVNVRISALLFPLLILFAAGAQAQSTFGPQPVGAASGAQNVTVTASVGGTVATVKVLTMGAPNLDFAPGS